MGSLIIVVLFFVVAVLPKLLKSGKSSKKKKTSPQRLRPDVSAAETYRTERRTTAKPNVPRKQKPDLRERFEAYKKKKQSSAQSAASVFSEKEEKTDILSAARDNTVEVALDNDQDALVAASTMDEIFDLIVKGPKDTLTHQRDFVAEGMDMLNRFTSL